MVIVLVGIISVIIAPHFVRGFPAFFTSRKPRGHERAGRSFAMDRMAREIRGVDPSQDFDPATLPTAAQFKFHIYNGTAQAAWVTYSLSGTSLMRNTDPWRQYIEPCPSGITSRTGARSPPPLTSAQAKSIWLVRITVGSTGGQMSESLRTTIFLRSGPMSR